MWKKILLLAAALMFGTATASAQDMSATARSGVETQLGVHQGKTHEGLPEGVTFRLAKRPANGSARIVMRNLPSPAGKPVRAAVIFYKSKKGFVGSDSFSYQRISRSGAVDNLSWSINVVP